mmetsp:Transcript_46140/g.144340  ORF Transcript_46140/g.144340 Transcript_46140/m.144340 type:complete len:231 (+) Transcript_46140:253-945(+)
MFFQLSPASMAAAQPKRLRRGRRWARGLQASGCQSAFSRMVWSMKRRRNCRSDLHGTSADMPPSRLVSTMPKRSRFTMWPLLVVMVTSLSGECILMVRPLLKRCPVWTLLRVAKNALPWDSRPVGSNCSSRRFPRSSVTQRSRPGGENQKPPVSASPRNSVCRSFARNLSFRLPWKALCSSKRSRRSPRYTSVMWMYAEKTRHRGRCAERGMWLGMLHSRRCGTTLRATP